MPLDPLAPLVGVNPFLSNVFNQVVNLLTGKMTDQPVTLADGLTVLGGITSSGSIISSGLAMDGVLYATSSGAIAATAAGSSNTVLVSQSSASPPLFSGTPVVGTLTTTGAATVGSGLTVSSGGSSLYGGVAVSSGNLSFGTTGQRITGDLSNATQANRVLFQTTTAAGAGFVGVMPNSSVGQAGFRAYGSNDPDNSAIATMSVSAAAGTTILDSNKTGTGTSGAWNFRVGGTTYLTIPITGGGQVNQGGFLVSSGGSSIYGGETISSGNLTVSAGNVVLAQKVTSYQNVTTAGWGVPAVYAEARSTGNTGANASVATYTVGAADGSFIVSGNLNITAFTAGTVSMTVAYTDEGGTGRTTNLSFQSLTGTIGITAGAAGAFEGIPLHIRCKASTTITFASTVSLFTGTYNAEGQAMQIA